ncbi:DUF167 domain-containing protein [Pacificibacter marinus]|uniref:UPF0235 protein PAM7971_00148 n=1 Tax=Pacificibacter marinus TaxID=658057 RepID=A0A1Y5RAF4_9RHOB|nr:DUF167 domain-containing protein [Pacificibacter marinus]SEK25792.1 hypothetical protein SAMN04488032_101499 [Pacificibacter marinus]SLN12875.1 hypothetical protein PAM7971_00148 [Pacificibacter marinus]
MSNTALSDKDKLQADLRAAVQENTVHVRVTPKASRNAVLMQDGAVRVYVTCVPENGKATKEVVKLLAKTLGVSKSQIALLRGAISRDKVFQITGL